jgi:hypothetical protein
VPSLWYVQHPFWEWTTFFLEMADSFVTPARCHHIQAWATSARSYHIQAWLTVSQVSPCTFRHGQHHPGLTTSSMVNSQPGLTTFRHGQHHSGLTTFRHGQHHPGLTTFRHGQQQPDVFTTFRHGRATSARSYHIQAWLTPARCLNHIEA